MGQGGGPQGAAGLARGWAALVSACLGFLMVGQVLQGTGSVPQAVAIGVATLVPAAALVRLPRARAATWGWVVGVGLPVVALAVAGALTTLS